MTLAQSLSEISLLVEELDNNLTFEDNDDPLEVADADEEGKEEVLRRLQSIPDLCQR